MAERLFTVYQVADLLGAVPGEVMGWIDRGWITARRISNEPLRISESGLIQFLKDRGIDIEKIMARAVLAEGSTPPRDVIPLPHELLNPMNSPRVNDAMPIDVEAQTPRPQLEATPCDADEPAPTAASQEPPAPPQDPPAQPQEPPADASLTAPAAQPQPQLSDEEINLKAAAQVAQAILKDAVARRATAIHIESPGGLLSLRLRIDGVMIDKVNFRARLPRDVAPLLAPQLLQLAGIDASGPPALMHAGFAQTFDGREVAFDLVACPTHQGPRLVIHVRDPLRKNPALGELGLAEKDDAVLRDLLAQRSGLILLTAPPGSGGNTTMGCMLVRSADKYRSAAMIQRQVGDEVPGVNHLDLEAAGLSPAAAIEAMVMQDTDVIALAELRDPPAAMAAYRAALDGRLVIARMFARSAPAAAAMLATMGPEAWPLSGTLLAVISQATVRRLCPNCRKETDAPELPERLGLTAGDVAFPTYVAQGCSQCGQTGYAGLVGVFSLLRIDDRVAAALRGGPDGAAIERAAAAGDFKTLLAAGLDKVRQGATTLAELARVL